MSSLQNDFGQPIGPPVPDWRPAKPPSPILLTGRFCSLERMDAAKHARTIYDIQKHDDDSRWTYLGYGPFRDFTSYHCWMEEYAGFEDPFFFTVLEKASGQPIGVLSYLRITPIYGTIEIGGINFSGRMQRQPASTETIYLLIKHAFENLGYRRVEWKCDANHALSRRAALRYGFQFEGIFRQHLMYKGRNRDTAWFSIIDSEWPGIKESFEQWLAPDNFDEQGKQKATLSQLRGS